MDRRLLIIIFSVITVLVGVMVIVLIYVSRQRDRDEVLKPPSDPLLVMKADDWDTPQARNAAILTVRKHKKIGSRVAGKFLEKQLDLGFLKRGNAYRTVHLDLDGYFDENNQAVQKADPFYEIHLDYFDEGVTLGPVWVVQVDSKEPGKVIPLNLFAELFEVPKSARTDKAKKIQTRLTQVVKAMINHEFDSKLKLGSFLVQRFVTRPESRRKEGDRIIGWTVNHVSGNEFIAYYQYVENGERRVARWNVTLPEVEEGKEASGFSFLPKGLLAIDLMAAGERFCPGKRVSANTCEATIDGLDTCPSDMDNRDSCDITTSGLCCKVTEAEVNGETRKRLTLTVDVEEPQMLQRLYKLSLDVQYPQRFKDFRATIEAPDSPSKGAITNDGPMWHPLYDANLNKPRANRWMDVMAQACTEEIGREPYLQPECDAFVSVLEQQDFVNAVQDLLAANPAIDINPEACIAREQELKKTLGAAPDADTKDSDSDGIVDAKDNCITLPNPQQAPGPAGVGRACLCAWYPRPVYLGWERHAGKEGDELPKVPEGMSSENHDVFEVIYAYREGDKTSSVGFYVISVPEEIKKDDDEGDKRKKRRKKPVINLKKRYTTQRKEFILPRDTVSEAAFWSVNPRNLFGTQLKAMSFLPDAERTELKKSIQAH